MTEELPLVSVIMPAYNAEKYIAEAIESVIAQTYTNWELIVVDDCSTDNTEKIVRGFNDCRIVIIKNDRNSGPAVSRNKAIERAKGEYIAFLDSDDIWMSEKLNKQVLFMRKNDIGFSCTAYGKMNSNGTPMTKPVFPFLKAGYGKCLLYGNCIGNSTAVYRVREGKIYAPEIRKRNDFALWLKVLRREKYCYGLKEILAYYRIRENSLSSDKKSLIKYQWELYRKIEKLPIAVCCFAFFTLLIRKALNYIRNS